MAPLGPNFSPFAYENMYQNKTFGPPGPRHRVMTKNFAPWPPMSILDPLLWVHRHFVVHASDDTDLLMHGPYEMDE